MTTKLAEELRAEAAKLREEAAQRESAKTVKCAQILMAAKGLKALEQVLQTGVTNDG